MIQKEMRLKREEKLLLLFNKFSFITVKQMQVIGNLGGYRNAHRILNEMEKDKLLLSYRMEQKVYYLSNKGKERIGSNQSDLKRNKIIHTLMSNNLYIKLDQPKTWEIEVMSTWTIDGEEQTLIPDARFKANGMMYFVEIDNTQTMKTNIDKIKRYKDLFYVIKRQLKYTPTLIWYTLTANRKTKLEAACVKLGVKFKVFIVS